MSTPGKLAIHVTANTLKLLTNNEHDNRNWLRVAKSGNISKFKHVYFWGYKKILWCSLKNYYTSWTFPIYHEIKYLYYKNLNNIIIV